MCCVSSFSRAEYGFCWAYQWFQCKLKKNITMMSIKMYKIFRKYTKIFIRYCANNKHEWINMKSSPSLTEGSLTAIQILAYLTSNLQYTAFLTVLEGFSLNTLPCTWTDIVSSGLMSTVYIYYWRESTVHKVCISTYFQQQNIFFHFNFF